ncbi:hypothetical protein PybrP1_008646 [[Pythium] brassicae (nom. inval.)]|nr:hypothetical protein PybrP1_008646 [[Pythium] brassicae (nom. inval.)]
MHVHEASHAAAYMMLFLPNGVVIVPAAPSFKSDVHAYGEQAQSNVLSFVKQNGSHAAAASILDFVGKTALSDDAVDLAVRKLLADRSDVAVFERT